MFTSDSELDGSEAFSYTSRTRETDFLSDVGLPDVSSSPNFGRRPPHPETGPTSRSQGTGTMFSSMVCLRVQFQVAYLSELPEEFWPLPTWGLCTHTLLRQLRHYVLP
jgi:hypothetical protein